MHTNSAALLDLHTAPKGDYRFRTLLSEGLERTPDGKYDFRGCKFPGLVRVVVEDADFSNSSNAEGGTGLSVSSSVIRRSLFDSAGPFSRLAGSFDTCDFVGIGARKSHVAGLFVSCSFRKSDFSGAMFVGNFENCIFDNCRLNLDALTAGFKNCIFIDSPFPAWLGDGAAIPSHERVTMTVKSGKVHLNEYIKFHNEPSTV